MQIFENVSLFNIRENMDTIFDKHVTWRKFGTIKGFAIIGFEIADVQTISSISNHRFKTILLNIFDFALTFAWISQSKSNYNKNKFRIP